MRGERALFAVLRVTVALCFIGHGAFGLVGKAAWVPFFTSVGISEASAWKLMPLVGFHDVALAALVLWKPRRALVLWMAAWCVWTACLRPISGESVWEVWERAGNFGPPLVLLFLGGPFALSARSLLGGFGPAELTPARAARADLLLRLTLALLLLGHAGFGFAVQKPMLLSHYASVGLPATVGLVAGVGYVELALAALVLFKARFSVAVLAFVLAWKLATEFLYVTSGPPLNIFEFIERWGDYGAPVALLILRRTERSVRLAPESA